MYYPAAAIPPSIGSFDTDTQGRNQTQINAWLNKE